MKKISPIWFVLLLLAICFTLGTLFVPRAMWWNDVNRAADWNQGQTQSENAFKLLLGEGRQLFANELFVMGDVYFHSGFYPSIFDQQEEDRDVAAPAHGQADNADPDEDYRGKPTDWIDRLNRHFAPNRHTHLSQGGANGHQRAATVEEILPWMKLSAEMNPQLIDSYTVAAYWLQSVLNKPDEAREFLFQGLRANPGNPELLFDLGRLYEEDYHDTNRAENVWKAALRSWQSESDILKTNTMSQFQCDEITVSLARAEEDNGNLPEAVHYFEIAKTVSPTPDDIQEEINRIHQKISTQSSPTNSLAP